MKIEPHPEGAKQSQMLKLLSQGTVMLCLDSRRPGVVVPEHLKNRHQVRLNFNYAYEINDMRVLPDRVEASLSFSQKNFFCVIPFTSVYLMINQGGGTGALFANSLPPELMEMIGEAGLGGLPLPAISVAREEAATSHATVVAAALPQVHAAVNPEKTIASEPIINRPAKPHLRLIK